MNLPIESFEDRTEATKFLAAQLRAGTLCLVIGAGASAPLGLPDWDGLLKECLDKYHLSPSTTPELSASVLGAYCKRNRIDIRDVVSDALYPSGPLTAARLAASPRLGALGALLIGSRRGSVQTVITFNFDSVLEEYLALHGFDSRVISTLPGLHGAEDVTIFHPHGYLPSDPSLGQRSPGLTLTKESFNQLLGDPSSPWRDLLRHIVRSKVLLLIGISEGSVSGGPLGAILQSEAASLASRGPSAVWLGTKALDEAHVAILRNQNVAAVRLPGYDAIDDFILEICQTAARQVQMVGTS